MKRNVLRVCVCLCGSYLLPVETWSLPLPDLWQPFAGSLNFDLTPGHSMKKVKDNTRLSHTTATKAEHVTVNHTHIYLKKLKGASSSDFGPISLGSEMFWQWLQILYITAARRHSLLFQSDLFKLIFFKMQSVSITIKRFKYFAMTQIQAGFIRFSSFKLLF